MKYRPMDVRLIGHYAPQAGVRAASGNGTLEKDT
jgi:hypothetical protein